MKGVPFAEAAARAARDMRGARDRVAVPPLLEPLPFAEESGDPLPARRGRAALGPVPSEYPRFKTTTERLLRFDCTKGCKGYDNVDLKTPHTPDYRARFIRFR